MSFHGLFNLQVLFVRLRGIFIHPFRIQCSLNFVRSSLTMSTMLKGARGAAAEVRSRFNFKAGACCLLIPLLNHSEIMQGQHLSERVRAGDEEAEFVSQVLR